MIMTLSPSRTLIGIDRFSSGFVKEKLGEDMARIVRQHAIASTAASVASAVPGAGTVACVIAQTSIVYTMYVRMNAHLGIRLRKNIVKSVASAVIANIATNAATVIGGIAASAVLSMIPGVGSAASAIVMCSVSYATVMIAGLVYAKTLSALAKSKRSIESMTEDELKKAVKEELTKRDINKDIKAFAKEYRTEKQKGTFEKAEAVELEAM